ncbi:MAG: NADH-quinone oxidoreductase subunit NuoK [Nitrososphaeria archaeon]|nr:NADH-quinone oxidoreductase subunit NuoK [Nitrososphaeria archaeon]NIQ32391.1 NADH-quinone oxidoreductase subunit NuoK [Nitrososphaeria archaeon]
MTLTIYLFILISALMFGIGVYGLASKRNMLRMLLSAEVMFNGALLALLTLSTTTEAATGGVIALLAIGLAAAEVGVVVSIVVLMFQVKRSIDIYEIRKLRE